MEHDTAKGGPAPNPARRFLVVTDAAFWRGESESERRVCALLTQLRSRYPDSAVYLDDALTPGDRESLAAAFPGLEVYELPGPLKLRRMRRNRFRAIARRLGARTPRGPLVREHREAFERICAALRPRVIVCTSPHLAELLERLSPRPRAWVDCHAARFLRHGDAAHEVAEAELERERIAAFDGLIAHDAADADALKAAFPNHAVVVAGAADSEAPFGALMAALEDAAAGK